MDGWMDGRSVSFITDSWSVFMCRAFPEVLSLAPQLPKHLSLNVLLQTEEAFLLCRDKISLSCGVFNTRGAAILIYFFDSQQRRSRSNTLSEVTVMNADFLISLHRSKTTQTPVAIKGCVIAKAIPEINVFVNQPHDFQAGR